METVSDEAKRARYASEDVTKIDELLGLSASDFTKLQLQKANELDDPDRIVNREIKLKQLTLETYGSLYDVDTYAGYRDKQEWASRRIRLFAFSKSRKEKLANAMLRHQSTPIHCALTDPAKVTATATMMPTTMTTTTTTTAKDWKTYDRKATILFKCVLGFLGDTKHPYPEQLAAEALALAFAEPSLRVEVYAQILKQLTENPVAASVDQGWSLLAAAFASFPPPPAFENHVARFVKQHASDDKLRDALTAALYVGVYGERRTHPLTSDDIPKVIAHTLNSDISARYLDADTVDATNASLSPPPPPKTTTV